MLPEALELRADFVLPTEHLRRPSSPHRFSVSQRLTSCPWPPVGKKSIDWPATAFVIVLTTQSKRTWSATRGLR